MTRLVRHIHTQMKYRQWLSAQMIQISSATMQTSVLRLPFRTYVMVLVFLYQRVRQRERISFCLLRLFTKWQCSRIWPINTGLPLINRGKSYHYQLQINHQIFKFSIELIMGWPLRMFPVEAAEELWNKITVLLHNLQLTTGFALSFPIGGEVDGVGGERWTWKRLLESVLCP